MGEGASLGGRRGDLAAELSRRELFDLAGRIGLAATIASLPASVLMAAEAGAIETPDGAALQAFADTLIPGRPADRTDLGDPIPARVIAGVDDRPGAVEADALRLFNNPLIGFSALAPAFLADLEARALVQGGDFVSLDFDRRVAAVAGGLAFENPLRLLWEAASAVPFTAFCAAANLPAATDRTASGYAVMGIPGVAPAGYRDSSYGRVLARERTRAGSLE